MAEFFDFSIWCAGEFVDFLLGLPFIEDISFGYLLIGVTIVGILIESLVGSLRTTSISEDAQRMNRADEQERIDGRRDVMRWSHWKNGNK